ncbi:MbtH family protein [Bradyrhizobium huanghuaihaiense]|uniref:MbtH family protein n=1 Tax=Bradyrhizobium huanghuaihaiense TaxID=990078 RepID=UPI00119EF1B4
MARASPSIGTRARSRNWSATMDADGFYAVVRNVEEQYSIWPQDREIPTGWTSVGFEGSKAECLSWISSNWTDIRPLTVRLRLAESHDSNST